jgi:hypothetical protein
VGAVVGGAPERRLVQQLLVESGPLPAQGGIAQGIADEDQPLRHRREAGRRIAVKEGGRLRRPSCFPTLRRITARGLGTGQELGHPGDLVHRG